MSNNKYRLPTHVQVCEIEGHFLFFNAHVDEYEMTSGEHTAAFAALVNQHESSQTQQHYNALWAQLCAMGLLTTSEQDSKPIKLTQVQPPAAALIDLDNRPKITINALHVWRFLRASWVAAMHIRVRKGRKSPFHTIVESIEKHRLRPQHLSADIATVRQLAAIFERLRLLLPKERVCLFDSVALMEFMAAYRAMPNLALGGRLDPWRAHSWLQGQDFVINEDPEVAAGFVIVAVL